MPSLFLAIAAGAAAAATPQSSEARLLNAHSIIRSDDYPTESIRKVEQGTVVVSLTVAPSGQATSCTVVKSSGYPALDERTCTLFQERGKFEPATDRNGQPVESRFTQTTTWRLVEGSMPRKQWMIRVTLALTRDGTILDCNVETSGIGDGIVGPCQPPRSSDSGEDEQASPFVYAITESAFYPVEPESAPVPPEVEDAQQLYSQVNRVTITPDGQLIACEGILYSGAASPENNQCKISEKLRFESAPGKAEPLVGTLVHSGYSRTVNTGQGK